MNSRLALHLFSHLGSTILGYLKHPASQKETWHPCHRRLKRTVVAISIVLVLLTTAFSAVAADVTIAPRFTPFEGKEIIRVRFFVDGKDVGKIQANDPFALKADNYAIIERKSGEADREIPLDGNPRPRGLEGIQNIFLIPKEEIPGKGKTYVLRVAHSLTIEAPDG